MDKNQLKKFLKPLVKECIREALLEDGILSGIISEVAIGLTRAPLLAEASQQNRLVDAEVAHEERLIQKRQQIEDGRQGRIKELNESFAGKLNGVSPFEGSTPLSPDEGTETHAAPGSLSGVDPDDAGVDITGLQALVGGRWNKQFGNKR